MYGSHYWKALCAVVILMEQAGAARFKKDSEILAEFDQPVQIFGEMIRNNIDFVDGFNVDVFSPTNRTLTVKKNMTPMTGRYTTGTNGGNFRGLSAYSYILKANDDASDVVARVTLPWDPQRLEQFNIEPANTFVGKMASDNTSWMVMDRKLDVNKSLFKSRVNQLTSLSGEYRLVGRVGPDVGSNFQSFGSGPKTTVEIAAGGRQEFEFIDGLRLSVLSENNLTMNVDVITPILPNMIPQGMKSLYAFGYVINTTQSVVLTLPGLTPVGPSNSTGAPMPGVPIQPGSPNQPPNPIQPGSPNQPGQSNQPAQPGQSNSPNQPLQPNQPNQPPQPGQTNSPNQPIQPNQPNQPSQPNQADQPPQPNQPNQPGQQADPSQQVQPYQPQQTPGATLMGAPAPSQGSQNGQQSGGGQQQQQAGQQSAQNGQNSGNGQNGQTGQAGQQAGQNGVSGQNGQTGQGVQTGQSGAGAANGQGVGINGGYGSGFGGGFGFGGASPGQFGAGGAGNGNGNGAGPGGMPFGMPWGGRPGFGYRRRFVRRQEQPQPSASPTGEQPVGAAASPALPLSSPAGDNPANSPQLSAVPVPAPASVTPILPPPGPGSVVPPATGTMPGGLQPPGPASIVPTGSPILPPPPPGSIVPLPTGTGVSPVLPPPPPGLPNSITLTPAGPAGPAPTVPAGGPPPPGFVKQLNMQFPINEAVLMKLLGGAGPDAINPNAGAGANNGNELLGASPEDTMDAMLRNVKFQIARRDIGSTAPFAAFSAQGGTNNGNQAATGGNLRLSINSGSLVVDGAQQLDGEYLVLIPAEMIAKASSQAQKGSTNAGAVLGVETAHIAAALAVILFSALLI